MGPVPPCLWSASPLVFLAFMSCGHLLFLQKASTYVVCTVWARSRDPRSRRCRRPLSNVSREQYYGGSENAKANSVILLQDAGGKNTSYNTILIISSISLEYISLYLLLLPLPREYFF